MRCTPTFFALSLLSLPLSAQSLNLRATEFGPVPSPGFGAATQQAGTWNAVKGAGFLGEATQTPLVDLTGAPTGAVAVKVGCDTYDCSVTGFGADIQALFAGGFNGDCFEQSDLILKGLTPGKYVLSAYAGPCFVQWNPILVELGDGSYSKTAQLGGTYDGTFDSLTLGAFTFQVPAGVDVIVSGSTPTFLAAAQLARIEPPAVFCTSKVNSQGCTGKIAALGNTASLGGVSPFHLVATDVVNDVPGLLFYGFASDIKPFLGGLHCVKPPTPRTTGQFSGGDGVPCGGTFDLDFNAWLDTDPQPKVHAGTRVFAQYWYRDVDDPFGAATTDAVSFHVVP
jgi:hypothetical protein